MRKLLVEGYTGSFPFIVDRSKPIISESRGNGQNVWRIPGRFSECDKVNGNNRRYSRKVWEKNLSEGSTLQTLIKENSAFGLLEHPADGKVDLNSPISHAVTKAVMESDGTITGEITIIDCGENSPGRKLKALVEFGYNPRVSSRGFGSLLKNSEGVDDVQEDYVCEGWDCVIKPSFDNALLTPDRSALDTVLGKKSDGITVTTESQEPVQTTESQEPRKSPVQEATPEQVDAFFKRRIPDMKSAFAAQHPGVPPDQLEAKWQAFLPELINYFHTSPEILRNVDIIGPEEDTLEPTAPTAEAQSVAAPTTQQPVTESSSMNINETKAKIAALKAAETSKLSPSQFAEGVAQMASLHNEVATYVAEDAKRSYEGSKLHKELETIETTWENAQNAPAKDAAKLREDRNKVLHVAKSLVETALKYKGALVEQMKTNAAQTKLVEELTTNGTGWMELANKRKERLDFVSRKYQVACEALMVMANRYKEDLTTVGRHALTLEFNAKLSAKPELQTALKEAKTPQDILAIREQLAEKPAEQAASAGTPPNTQAKEGTPAAQESKTATAAASSVTESKPKAAAPPIMVVEDIQRNPRSVTEAAAIAQRLSLASAK
jgi:hypothetical protein